MGACGSRVCLCACMQVFLKERRKKLEDIQLCNLSFCLFFFFFPGHQSRGQTPWIHGTLRTMIPGRPWTAPPDNHRPDSYYIHLPSMSASTSHQPCWAVRTGLLPVTRFYFAPPPPPPPASWCLLAVNWPWRGLLRQIWMATSFLLSNFF